MNISEFTTNVAEQFDDLEGEILTASTCFRDVSGWSSITALSIIAMIDEEYDVQLTGADIRASNTIQDIFDKVVDKKG